jgi:hypothetical protein
MPSDIRPVPHCESFPIPEPPPPSNYFFLECDDEEENTPEETLQPSTTRNPEFFLNITLAESDEIMQKEISGLIRDLEVSKNKA